MFFVQRNYYLIGKYNDHWLLVFNLELLSYLLVLFSVNKNSHNFCANCMYMATLFLPCPVPSCCVGSLLRSWLHHACD